MTNSNSTYPQEWIAQDSIQMQSELAQQMNNDCEIGTIGKYVVKMSLADLKEIANKRIVRQLQSAIEVIQFYAYNEQMSSRVAMDWLKMNGETLEEIENDKQS